MKIRILFLAALVILNLSSCGFHLRGQGQSLSDLPPLAVTGGDRSRARLDIERVLGGPGGPLVANVEDAQVIIHIMEDLIEERVLTVNTNARVTEYELAYLVTFELLDNAEEVLREPERIVVTGDFTFDSNVLLGKGAERSVVERELVRRAAQRILRSTWQSTLKK